LIHVYFHQVDKIALLEKVADKELAMYNNLDGEINRAISDTRTEIDGLKSQLIEERVVRRHKEEYEEFAKVVNKHSLRSELVAKTTQSSGGDLQGCTHDSL
jgi:hypothetical protein